MYRIILSLFIILLSTPGHGQDLNYAKEVIKILSSPEFKGRGYTGNGHRIAAEYIADQFRDIGLNSFQVDNNANSKTYMQPFEISVNTFPAKMKLSVDGKSLIPGTEFLVHPSSAGVKGRFPIFFIKKEDLLDSVNWEKIVNASRGHFIAVDERTFNEKSVDLLNQANEKLERIKFGSEVPSIGTIMISNEKLTWGISVKQANKPVLIVNSDKITAIPAQLDLNIGSKFAVFQTNNLIGFIPGRTDPDSFLIIVAHYDHLGKMGKEVYFPGANDNASGISMMLNLARYFKAHPHRLSIVFIAMGAEETGLNGARHFVENPVFELSKIAFLLNFDLAGTGEEGIKVVNGSIYPEKFGLLKKINSDNGFLKDVQSRGPACNSDHCMFHENGVPCFYIYTLGGIQAYHDIYDKSETLPLTGFSGYFKLIVGFLENENF
jgi:aminopeptidase YwaD